MDIIKELEKIVSKHRTKFDNLKTNLSNSDEEQWTEMDIQKAEYAISILAPILSDLNRLIAIEEAKKSHSFVTTLAMFIPSTDSNRNIGINFIKNGQFIEQTDDESGLSGKVYKLCIVLNKKPKLDDWSVNITSPYEHMELCKIDNLIELENYVNRPTNSCSKVFIIGDKDSPSIHQLDIDMILERSSELETESVPIDMKLESFTYNPETKMEYKSTDTMSPEDCEERYRPYLDIYDNLHIVVK